MSVTKAPSMYTRAIPVWGPRALTQLIPVPVKVKVARAPVVLDSAANGLAKLHVGPPELVGQAELVQAMAQTGRATLDSIDRSLVRTDFP